MNTNELARAIDEFGMGAHRDFLLRFARPSIEIATAPDGLRAGTNKLGGSPDLPDGFGWPRHAAGLCKFIGQFDLSHPAFGPFGLPPRGILSVFFTADGDGYQHWGNEDFLRVFHFEDVAGLKPVTPPDAVARGATRPVELRPGLELPDREWLRRNKVDWPYSEDEDSGYWDLRWRLHPEGRFFFGYPCNSTLGSDPTPGPDTPYSDSHDVNADWRSFLTLFSNDELDWCWHDWDWLVSFIRDERLRAGDFSTIRATAG